MAAEDLVASLRDLEIEGLSASAVNLIWDGDFENDDLHIEMDALPCIEHFEEIMHRSFGLVQTLLGLSNADKEEFWRLLMENGIEVKSVTALLYYTIEMGLKKGSSSQQQHFAFQSAQFYVLACALPSSTAYHLFDALLFQRAIDCSQLYIQSVKPKDSPTKKRGPQRRGQAASRNVVTPNESDLMEDDSFEDSQPNSQETSVLSAGHLQLLRKCMSTLLKCLWRFLGSFPLQENRELCGHVAHVLCEVLSVDAEDANVTVRTNSETALGRLGIAELAFANLHALCENKQGEIVTDGVMDVLKCLLPVLLLSSGAAVSRASLNVTSAAGKRAIRVKDLAQEFVRNLLEAGDNAERDVSGPVVILLQHLCAKAPERADPRRLVLNTVVSLMFCLPTAQQFRKFFDWILKYGRSPTPLHRSFAIDLCKELLARSFDDVKEPIDATALVSSLLVHTIHRCSDKSPAVRTKAITTLASIFAAENPDVQAALHLLATPENPRRFFNIERTPLSMLTPSRYPRNTSETSSIDGVAEITLEDKDGLVSLLRRRCEDEKTTVRRAATQAIGCAMLFLSAAVDVSENVACLKDRCLDPAVSVRKTALESITLLLRRYPDNRPLSHAWISAILPLVTDRETTVQEKAMEMFGDVVVANVGNKQGPDATLAWSILNIIECGRELYRYLTRTLQYLKKNARLSSRIVSSIQQSAVAQQPQHKAACWLLLSQLSNVVTVPLAGAIDAWFSLSPTDSTLRYVAKVIINGADDIAAADARRLINDLQNKLTAFLFVSDNIAVAVYLLSRLCAITAKDADDVQGTLLTWATSFMDDCRFEISLLLGKGGAIEGNLAHRDTALSDEKFLILLSIVGELVQHCPQLLSASLFDDIETISLQSKPKPNVDKAHRKRLTPTIRAYGMVTLGKFCLRDEDLAKTSIDKIMEELNTSQEATIRNNIVVILCDLCIRFTALIDRYVPQMTLCLKDDSVLVRKQTLSVLTSLLKEDFLRWKGTLFFRFLVVLLDDSLVVSQFCEFCLTNVLFVRHPDIMFHHFVESVFVLNDCEHGQSQSGLGTAKERKLFGLTGKGKREERMRIYKFMIEHLTNLQRFNVSNKLCQDILGAVVDETLPIAASTQEVIADALTILTFKELKLSPLIGGAAADEDEDGEEVEGGAERLAMANKLRNVITEAMKQNTIQTTVPILIALKRMLEKKHSPLLRELMAYLRDLYSDHKNEVDEIFAADKQLAAEIAFDLRRFAQQEEAEARKAMRTSTVALQQHVRQPTILLRQMTQLEIDRATRRDTTRASVNVTSAALPVLNESCEIVEAPASPMSVANGDGEIPEAASRQGGAQVSTPLRTPASRYGSRLLREADIVSRSNSPTAPVPIPASPVNGASARVDPTTSRQSHRNSFLSPEKSSFVDTWLHHKKSLAPGQSLELSSGSDDEVDEEGRPRHRRIFSTPLDTTLTARTQLNRNADVIWSPISLDTAKKKSVRDLAKERNKD